jgi:hypothetical protein
MCVIGSHSSADRGYADALFFVPQMQMTQSATLSTPSTTSRTLNRLFPVNAGSWYMSVTGDCSPAATCGYTVQATPEVCCLRREIILLAPCSWRDWESVDH